MKGRRQHLCYAVCESPCCSASSVQIYRISRNYLQYVHCANVLARHINTAHCLIHEALVHVVNCCGARVPPVARRSWDLLVCKSLFWKNKQKPEGEFCQTLLNPTLLHGISLAVGSVRGQMTIRFMSCAFGNNNRIWCNRALRGTARFPALIDERLVRVNHSFT